MPERSKHRGHRTCNLTFDVLVKHVAVLTIELLRRSFTSLGLPEVVVSDNATAFTSGEFSNSLRRNGIKHTLTPPYHPASNGLVECSVQTFKERLKRLKEGFTEYTTHAFSLQIPDNAAQSNRCLSGRVDVWKEVAISTRPSEAQPNGRVSRSSGQQSTSSNTTVCSGR